MKYTVIASDKISELTGRGIEMLCRQGTQDIIAVFIDGNFNALEAPIKATEGEQLEQTVILIQEAA